MDTIPAFRFLNSAQRGRLFSVVTGAAAYLLLSLVLISGALAQKRVSLTVTCQGKLPFVQSELLEAIWLRLPLMVIDQKRIPPISVRNTGVDGASITVGSSQQVVSIHGLTSTDAVRIVALLALDLAYNLQKNDARADLGSPSAVVRSNQPPSAPRSDFIFVGFSPRAAFGVSEWSAAFEPTLDVSVKVSRYLLLFLEGGFSWVNGGEGARSLTLHEIPVRAGIGLRYAWFEVRAGGSLRPYVVNGAGDDSGVLAGGGLGLYARYVFSRWLTGYVGSGLDLYAVRKELRVGGETVLTTSHVVPWLGIGAGWQGG